MHMRSKGLITNGNYNTEHILLEVRVCLEALNALSCNCVKCRTGVHDKQAGECDWHSVCCSADVGCSSLWQLCF